MVFKRPEQVFVAYADREGRNELLIRKGKKYFVLTSQHKIFPVTPDEAYRTLKLVQDRILKYRGAGTFNKNGLFKKLKGANN